MDKNNMKCSYSSDKASDGFTPKHYLKALNTERVLCEI